MSSVDTRFNQSVAKAFDILEAFSVRPGVLSLNELMEISSLDRNSTLRMLHTLVALGYVERGPNQRGYMLGKKILHRTFDYLRGNPLIERANQVLIELQQESNEGVDLSLHDDLEIVYALRRQTRRRYYFATLVGRTMPVYRSCAGRAIMARLPDERVDDILARSDLVAVTPHTLVDPSAIWEKIEQARLDGYAMTLQESLLGELAVSAAVVDHSGLPVAAIHIYGLLSQWTPKDFAQRFGPLVINAAQALSTK
ncbi:IclR family transcriptional regulator [Bordetella petrii]|uniref:IclR family transcriptional regulator n=1 Tax=Bordetella petrii TaxID=94624 RepID=UPI001E5D54BF|nr:IclR family transcriptional regulator [Bordetella petrii]MCD0502265.1 IclR family transcriptional regulator [Bordetella petrii]